MKGKQNKITIIILLCLNGFAYYTVWPVVLMHQYYYDAMQAAFELTHGQMGMYGLISGICSLVGYIISGIFADIFETKKLLLTSLAILIGGYGVMMLLPSYHLLLVIALVLTLTCVGTFWGAFAKYVRILGDNDPTKESKMYGLQYAFVGIGGALLGTIGARLVAGAVNVADGMRHMLMLNCGIVILAFLANLFLFKPQITLVGTGEDKFKLSYIKDVLKMPVFWLMAVTIMAIYGTSVATSYMSPLLYNLGVPLGIVSAIGSFKYFAVRLIFAPVGGAVMDKAGSPMKVITFALIVSTVCLILQVITGANTAFLLIGVIIICSIIYQISTPGWFSSLTEARIPEKYKGTAVGLFSAIFQSPDAYGYAIGGMMLTKFGEERGYPIIFGMWAVIGVIGVICGFFALKLLKRQKS